MEIHWQGQISQDDLTRAIEAHFPMRRVRWGVGIWFALVALPFLGLGVTAILGGDSSLLLRRDTWYALLLLAAVFLIMAMVAWLPRWSARHAHKANPAFQHPIAGSASPHGLHVRAWHSESGLAWEAFDHYLHSGDLVLLYLNRALFHVFPRRFFANDTDWRAFLELIAGHVPTAEARARQGGTTRLSRRGFFILLVVVGLVVFLVYLLLPGPE